MEKLRRSRKYIAIFALLITVLSGCYLDLNCLSNVTNSHILIATIVSFVVFALCVVISNTSKRVKFNKVLMQFGENLIVTGFFFAGSLLLSRLTVENNILSKVIVSVYCFLILAILVFRYIHIRKQWGLIVSSTAVRKSAVSSGEIKFLFTYLYSIILLLLIAQVVMLFTRDFNIYLVVPVIFALLSLVLWKFIKWRGVLLVNVTSVLYVLMLCKIHNTSLSISNLPIFTIMTACCVGLILPLFDLYTRKEENI